MTWGTQLFLSADEKKRYSLEDLETELKRVVHRPGINRLMFWNTRDDEYTEAVLRICRESSTECWLWFPVLADSLVSSENARPSVNHRGGSGLCSPGAMTLEGDGEEEFSFLCPSDRAFEEQTEAHLAELLDRYDFDGVFLDRIRFPSFANGLPLLYSCVCPECCRRMNIDREQITREFESLKGDAFLSLFCGIGDAAEVRKNYRHIQKFIEERMKLITDKVERLNRIIRSRDRAMALDLFTPGLARAVGQDYSALSRLADWVKTMTYAMAWGPAGIPLELDCLYRGIRETFPDLGEDDITNALGYMMGCDLKPYWENRSSEGFPSSLAYSEWKRTEAFSENCRFLPGIELVHSELFKTKVPESRAAEAVELFGEKTEIIACWNCLEIPDRYFTMLDRG